MRGLVGKDWFGCDSLKQVLRNRKRVILAWFESLRIYGMEVLEPLETVEISRKTRRGRGT